MRLLTNLLTKVTLSSMILTAPAMINGNTKYSNSSNPLPEKSDSKPFYSSSVIRKFIDHPSVVGIRAVPLPAPEARPVTPAVADAAPAAAAAVTAVSAVTAVAAVEKVAAAEKVSARTAELKLVINQASLIYGSMNLEKDGLDQKAFEYAWRGYHNLLKKGMIRKHSVLSICDFSQSSSTKRMYVIDVLHRKLLYQTYVAHGQNSGDEFATTFSNEPDSYKSSLGFYVTQRTYIGHNGLSLKLNGVDSGYNDMALKRQIVLHGSSYVGDRYMKDYGTLGTSLGCPALPASVSAKIIRTVKDGSVLFIYHPTQQYLSHSPVINGYI